MLRLLLEAGADLHATDADGDTPLLFALKIGAWEAAEELAVAGAPLSGEDGMLQVAVAAGGGAEEEVAAARRSHLSVSCSRAAGASAARALPAAAAEEEEPLGCSRAQQARSAT